MIPLDKDLQGIKQNLDEFAEITKRILLYIPNVLSDQEEKGDYKIYSSQIAGTVKFIRPINKTLFLGDMENFYKSSVYSG